MSPVSGGVPEQGLREIAQQKIAQWRAVAAQVREDLKGEIFEGYDRLDVKRRVYEACADDLEAALERPRPAPREAIHPISEAAQKVVEAYESGIIANRDAAVNDLREMLARPAPPATEPPMQCRHGAITQCRSCAGERADEIMERLAHR